jgi:hypothetical protein
MAGDLSPDAFVAGEKRPYRNASNARLSHIATYAARMKPVASQAHLNANRGGHHGDPNHARDRDRVRQRNILLMSFPPLQATTSEPTTAFDSSSPTSELPM